MLGAPPAPVTEAGSFRSRGNHSVRIGLPDPRRLGLPAGHREVGNGEVSFMRIWLRGCHVPAASVPAVHTSTSAIPTYPLPPAVRLKQPLTRPSAGECPEPYLQQFVDCLFVLDTSLSDFTSVPLARGNFTRLALAACNGLLALLLLVDFHKRFAPHSLVVLLAIATGTGEMAKRSRGRAGRGSRGVRNARPSDRSPHAHAGQEGGKATSP